MLNLTVEMTLLFERFIFWLRQLAGMVARSFHRRRVPVLLQLNGTECGAACLAMILSYYGRPTAVAECREQCGVGRDGLTAQIIARAARSYGLRVKAYSVQRLADFQHVPLPAIIHWGFRHFVVVESWSPTHVDLVDPALGRRRLTLAEFGRQFTGVVLTFEPGLHFERRRKGGRSSWRTYLNDLLRLPGIWRLLGQILGASLLLQLLGLALPVLTKVFVDDVLPLRLDNVMGYLGLGIVLLLLAQVVTAYLRAALLIYLQGHLDTRLMLGFFEHVLALPYTFFQQRSSGDLLMRLSSNTAVRELLTNQTVSAILDGSLVLVYLFIILNQSLTFGLLVCAIGAVQVLLLLGTTRPMHRLAQQDLQAQAESQGYLVEALGGIATLKASGAEDRALDHWSNLFFTQLNVSLRRNHFSAIIDVAMGALRSFSPLLLLWVGALYVLNGTMSLGTMLALNALAVVTLTPLASLVTTGQQLQLVGAHLERIADVVRAEPEQALEAGRRATHLRGQVELREVSFRYDPHALLVLQDVSLVIESGQKVAIVGPTGSGKSTLAKLLLGFYSPTAGTIRYDGVPLTDWNYRDLRRQFGVVLQDASIFNGSIRQNISLNDPDTPLEQVMQAARLAVIHDDIMQMPLQYETPVSERGSGLSGGQRQRLALARALVHEPALLLLDEATSHLDTVTEAAVHANLNRLNCTRIVIAHRLSTIRDADAIFVLEAGRVVERGRHEELLAHQGAYAALVHNQGTGEEGRPAAFDRTSPITEFVFPGLSAAGREQLDKM